MTSSKAASASVHRCRSIQARARAVGSGPKRMGSSRHRPSISGGPPSCSSRSRSWHQAALSRACTEPCSSSARPVTTSVQAAIRGRSSGNSATGQSRAVWSPLPVRTALPSGLNATAVTWPWCARGGPMGRPVAASQSRAVLSSLPVRTALPSGLNATALTEP